MLLKGVFDVELHDEVRLRRRAQWRWLRRQAWYKTPFVQLIQLFQRGEIAFTTVVWAANNCTAIAEKKPCVGATTSDNLRAPLAALKQLSRNVALTMRILTDHNCNAIVPKKRCVAKTCRNLRVLRTLFQHGKIP